MNRRHATTFACLVVAAAALLLGAAPAHAAEAGLLARIATFAHDLGATVLSAAVTYFSLLPFYSGR